MTEQDLSQLPMLELFRIEAESQTQLLTTELLRLEQNPDTPEALEACMRAAHSLKGAARIVGLNPAVTVTHAMEDCFVAAQRGLVALRKPQIDLLLGGVDLITKLANTSETELAGWAGEDPAEVRAFLAALERARAGGVNQSVSQSSQEAPVAPIVSAPTNDTERSLRVTAHNFNRLLGLSAQSLVESRWLGPFATALLALKRQQEQTATALDSLREAMSQNVVAERAEALLADTRQQLQLCQTQLAQRLDELDAHDRRASAVARRMYEEALSCRMRPFSDRTQAFPRMLRDLSQSLGKQARLEIAGETTAIDRDVLEKLEAPLTHLLRNAIDHGVDPPELRRAAGKDATGVVRLEASHRAGMLHISVSDDGQGIDVERVRQVIVERALIDAHTASRLSDTELYTFLFLPGFSVRQQVTEISGRGVGLDAVQTVVKLLRGSVRVSSRPGEGTRFELQLPLAVSFVRSLIVEIAGEAYAFPLTQIDKTLTLERSDVKTLEGRQHFEWNGRQIGLVRADQILDGGETRPSSERLSVVVVSDHDDSYGLIVDHFVSVRELVVHALDARLGKIKDVSAGGLLEDGSPVLIVDVEDLVRSIEKLIALGGLSKIEEVASDQQSARKKRVLVVDDSFTVRELERKLIGSGGYEVEVAVDGVDGWNAVRVGSFDLVVTDVDMPRMDGIELVRLIKKDARLRSLPVMIVSYKDREEDKQRGLDAGADFYLAKSSFRNEGLLEAVVDLIGEARA